MSLYLGLDGGGTKTEAALINSQGRLVGQALAGPSNPLRAGFARSLAAVAAAASRAIAAAGCDVKQVRGVSAGLAGAGRAAVAKKVSAFLCHRFPNARTEVTTDVVIALDSIAPTGPAMVLIAGTGSAAFGRNGEGATVRVGGWGPWFSDEGSAFDIGRRALAALARNHDAARPPSALDRAIAKRLNARNWTQMVEEATTKPLERLPEIFPAVVEAAEAGDSTAQAILAEAADRLAALAETAILRLGLAHSEFALGRVGGIFGRTRFLDERLAKRLGALARRARIVLPRFSPAVAAAHRARSAAGKSAPD
ncbi:MAG TPA: BadF/BadG/BcrA/BcrD ATPase family protein [Candidatus Acidoferrales bacterium]|nr:BadF/BadG/BcrA/BcrD ATPase family protein [Candidatus Acidoferrales bacterium]